MKRIAVIKANRIPACRVSLFTPWRSIGVKAMSVWWRCLFGCRDVVFWRFARHQILVTPIYRRLTGGVSQRGWTRKLKVARFTIALIGLLFGIGIRNRRWKMQTVRIDTRRADRADHVLSRADAQS